MGNKIGGNTHFSEIDRPDLYDSLEDDDLEILNVNEADWTNVHAYVQRPVRRADREHRSGRDREYLRRRAAMNRRISEMEKDMHRADQRKRLVRSIPGFVLTLALSTVSLWGAYTGLSVVRRLPAFTTENGSDDRQLAMADDSIYEEETPAAPVIAGADDTADDFEEKSADAEAEWDIEEDNVYSAEITPSTGGFGEDVISSYGILVDADNMEIVAERNSMERMYPASMTKVMTLLVAVENLSEEDFDNSVEITREITDYTYSRDCSAVGFDVGEDVPVKDLLYGLILPSGADAALALADYVAGSHEAFVDMMNDKLRDMGLSGSAHFTNCVGLYDDEHYCTAYDMAMIMKTALDNDLCREVLSCHHYVTTSTQEHPEGIEISNWFLRRIEDRDLGGDVLCGKTGFVVQSGNCAVSFAVADDGRSYVCCTGNSTSSWNCIDDHTLIYQGVMGTGSYETASLKEGS
ncbi:D-alanyl-D-alanine carboxypeptidase family protein [Butyrivibrio sp. MC2013]|uniref:D-alanyl-D-alanine carboxypeptidase family protein n=1 Tax=Butyrivibrio sp. MC2013 TaxID=1280686 RepID=UPI00040F70FA|nr:serine hydrolase [Butyrivibrio sp. MC2013]